MSNEQIQNEINYKRAKKYVERMLTKGIITQALFKEIDRMNREVFCPELAELYG